MLTLLRLLSVVFILVAVGCTSIISAPAEVERGVHVYLVNAALHSGIVLPDGPNRWIEYGFGEYEWYAMDNAAWYRVFPSVLWPTGGALGKREFSARSDQQVQRQAYAHRVDKLWVEQSKVAALKNKLSSLFKSREPAIYQPRYRMHFVRDGSYWMLGNCHDQTAAWFEQLDCKIGWSPIRLGLAID